MKRAARSEALPGKRAGALLLANTHTWAAYAFSNACDGNVYMHRDAWQCDTLAAWGGMMPADATLFASFARPGIGNGLEALPALPVENISILSLPRRAAADAWALAYLTGEIGLSDFDMATDTDLHEQGVRLLSRYQTLVLVVHPEYWTKQQWEAVQAHLAGGGSLAYLGGNGAYRRVSYGRTRHGMPRIEKYSSNSFAWNIGGDTGSAWGLRYTGEGHGTFDRFTVTDSADALWAGLHPAPARGDQVGSRMACGWETDPPNAAAPAGTRVVGRGENPGQDAGCALLTRDLPAGGRLTALGSITGVAMEQVLPGDELAAARMRHAVAYALNHSIPAQPRGMLEPEHAEPPCVARAGVHVASWHAPGQPVQPGQCAHTARLPHFLDQHILTAPP